MGPAEQFIWSKNLHWEHYFRPRDIPEALELLEEFRGRARIIAGGTDVLVQIRKGEIKPDVLVDVTRIEGLDRIRLDDGIVEIGALVTHSQVVESCLLREKGLALVEGASQIGSPQIRNIGTVVGNLVSGQPGADTAVPLLALNGALQVVSSKGERTVPLIDLFIGAGKTVVDSTKEVVAGVSFPALRNWETSVCLRLARRKALALPILNVSIVVSIDPDKKTFREVRIALGPVAPVPFRARQAERLLASAPISDEVIEKAAQQAAQESNPRSSPLRGSEEYRREMVTNLVGRGIRQGLERLEASHE
jgi:carbon-monoxide dehydrogenase medium subunit